MADREAVLLVDDDRDLTATLSEFLEGEGYRVIAAHSLEEGRQHLRQGGIGLAILDLFLPDGDGLELTRESSGIVSPPEYLVVTGQASPDSAAAAAMDGAVGYLMKPLELGRLGVIVRRVFERRRLTADNRHLQGQLAERLAETEALAAISSTVSSTLDLREALRRVCRELARLLGADTASAYLHDPGTDQVMPWAGYHVPKEHLATLAGAGIPLSQQGFHLSLWNERQPVWSDDVGADPRFGHELFRSFRHQSGLLLPLVLDGEVAGAFYVVWWTARRQFDEQELETLRHVADQVSLLLRNARLYEREERNRRRLEVLNHVARRLAAVHDPEEVLSLIVNEAARLLDADAAGLRLLEGDELVLAARTESAAAVMSRPRIKVGESLSGRVIVSDQPIVISNLVEDPRHDPVHRRGAIELGYHGFAGVPLRVAGRAMGTLNLFTRAVRCFQPDEIALLEAFADQAVVAIEKARFFRETEAGRQLLDQLYRAATEMQASWSTEDRLKTFVRATHEILGFDRVRVYLISDDGTTLELATAVGEGGVSPALDRLPLSPAAGPFHQAIAGRRTVTVLSDDDLAGSAPGDLALLGQPIFRSTRFVVAPLVVGERALGAVGADNKPSRRPISRSAVEPFTTLCQSLALALDQSRLYTEATTREREAVRLYEVTRQLATSLDASQLLDLIVGQTIELLGCDAAGIYGYDAVRGVLTFSRGRNLAPELMQRLELKPGEGAAGLAFRDRRPVWTDDRLTDSRLHYSPPAAALVDALAPRAFLAVPIVGRTEVHGVLLGFFFAPHRFDEREIRLLSTLADQAAITLENARLYREQEERLGGLQALARLNQLISSSLEMGDVLAGITGAAAELMRVPLAGFWLADDTTRTLTVGAFSDPKALAVFPFRTVPYGEGSSGTVAASRTPLHVPDVFATELVRSRAWWHAHGLSSFYGVPVFHGDSLLAVLALYGAAPFRLQPAEQTLLDTFVGQAALAIRNARSYADARQRTAQITTLASVGDTIASTLDLDAVLEAVLDGAKILTGARRAAVFEMEGDGRRLTVRATRGGGVARGFSVRVGHAAAGSAVQRREPVWSGDVLGNPLPGFDAFYEELGATLGEVVQRQGYRGILAVPLVVGEAVLGAICVYWTEVHAATEQEVRLLTALARQAAVAVDKARLYAETQAQRARLAQIFNSTSDGIVLIGRDGEILAANRQAGELLGFEAEDVVGVRLDELLAGFRSSVPAYEAVFGALRAQIERPERAGEGDLELRRHGRVVHWVARPTRDALGDTRGVTLTVSDVTQERQVSQMKSDFVSFVTHQLRTPLAGIKWMLELGAEAPGVPAETSVYIRDAREAAERLIGLVSDLLDISRLESGRLTVAREALDLAALTQGVLADLSPLVSDKGHRLVVQDNVLPDVLADRQLLRQVILNLTSNAIKYTPAGGDITIRLRAESGRALWEVQDSGIGIPRASQRRLFEKFYRADNVHKLETEGTGLGLYLVRLLVEKLGGDVWCESEEGQGATFIFTLPLSEHGR